MKTFELKGEIREGFGKKAAKDYRKQGLIPCIIYGGEDDNINFVVKEGDVRKLIYTPSVFLINLDLGTKKLQAILKDLQFHPVTDSVLHIDFLYVSEKKPIVIDIPVRLDGLAAGVKAGGRLTLDSRKLKVRAYASKLPDELLVNVTKLQLGKSIQVGDLNFEGLELLDPKDSVVASVRVLRAMKSAEEIEEEEEGEEGEEDESGDDAATE